MRKRLLILLVALFTIIINLNAQTTIFFQGFEGGLSCSENWAFSGGNVNSQTARTGSSSARVGRVGESNTLLFNTVNVATLTGVQLQIYHSVRGGSGPGMDAREGAAILVSLNGAAFSAIGQVGGFSDGSWAFSTMGGASGQTCLPAYTMPNPFSYNVPAGTTTLQIKIISFVGGSCGTFQTNMAAGNAGNYDRNDEGFFVDDVKLTTSSTAIPGTWTGAVNTDWFNCLNWSNNKIPNSLTDVVINQAALNDCIVDLGGNAVCRDINLSSNNATTPDLIIQNGSSLISGGNLAITKSSGIGTCKTEVLNTSVFTCNNVTLNGSSSGAANAVFINENNTNTVTFTGNFNLNNGGELDMTTSGNYGILNLKGDYNNNALETDFKQTNSIINLNGITNQTINTNSFTEIFSNLVINKSAGTVLLNDNINIEVQLKLQNGLLDLNSKNMHVLNNSANGIIRSAGGIISEKTNNSSTLSWQIGMQNGNFIFPFIRQDASYIPFLFNHISGDAGIVSIATYGTTRSNYPWPLTPTNVTNLNSIYGSNDSDATVNRFWQINSTAAPLADITFNYAANELPVSPFNSSANLRAQYYNTLSNTWQNYLPLQAAGSYFVTVPAVTVTSLTFTLTHINSPLPVELVSFDAKLKYDKILTKWITATEVNNDYFTVEKSKNGTDFITVSKVKGAGNSNGILEYELWDTSPFLGISYYRLKQTDFDGKFSYSNAIAVNNDKKSSFAEIFPNPVKDHLVINTNELKIDAVFFYDVQGKEYKIDDVTNNNIITIDISNFSSGFYFLKIISGEIIQQEKIFKL